MKKLPVNGQLFLFITARPLYLRYCITHSFYEILFEIYLFLQRFIVNFVGNN